MIFQWFLLSSYEIYSFKVLFYFWYRALHSKLSNLSNFREEQLKDILSVDTTTLSISWGVSWWVMLYYLRKDGVSWLVISIYLLLIPLAVLCLVVCAKHMDHNSKSSIALYIISKDKNNLILNEWLYKLDLTIDEH